jgi:hypothetical protein
VLNHLITKLDTILSAAAEKGSFDFRKSPDYTYPDLKSVSQTYKLNVWYKMELTYNTKTNVTGRLYSSNGTTAYLKQFRLNYPI